MPQNRRFQYQNFSSLTPLPGSCAFQFDTFQVEGPQAFQGCPQAYGYTPLSEPVRSRRWLSAAVIASGLFWNPFTPTAEAVTVDKWFQPLSQPVRVKRFPASEQQVATIPPAVVVPSPLSWLSEPVRSRALPAALRLVDTKDPVTPTVVTVDQYPIGGFWSTPVRTKPGLLAAARPFSSWLQPVPIIRVDWFNSLSEPKRFKRSVPTQAQPVSTADTKPSITISWFNSLSEPKRFKRAILAQLQPFSTKDIKPTVPRDWFALLSEPRRFKRGLLAALQKSIADSPFVGAPVAHINLTLTATETGDTFSATFEVFAESPTGAIVGIKEIPRLDSAILGTVETPYETSGVDGVFQFLAFQADAFQVLIGDLYFQPTAIVSIVEVEPIYAIMQQTETAPVFANVGIIEIEP